jgi:hypothetical protein
MVSLYFVNDSVRKLLGTTSYTLSVPKCVEPYNAPIVSMGDVSGRMFPSFLHFFNIHVKVSSSNHPYRT